MEIEEIISIFLDSLQISYSPQSENMTHHFCNKLFCLHP